MTISRKITNEELKKLGLVRVGGEIPIKLMQRIEAMAAEQGRDVEVVIGELITAALDRQPPAAN